MHYHGPSLASGRRHPVAPWRDQEISNCPVIEDDCSCRQAILDVQAGAGEERWVAAVELVLSFAAAHVLHDLGRPTRMLRSLLPGQEGYAHWLRTCCLVLILISCADVKAGRGAAGGGRGV